jgi:hypothetical protein
MWGILDFGFWILDFGFWILDFGFWILDFGFKSKSERLFRTLPTQHHLDFTATPHHIFIDTANLVPTLQQFQIQ